MKKQVRGIGFILFGMLLVLIAAGNNDRVPMMPRGIGGAFSFLLLWPGLAMGIAGPVFSEPVFTTSTRRLCGPFPAPPR